MALAHSIENKVEAAYRRGDLFEKRRKLMEAWAGYCERPREGAKVRFDSLSERVGGPRGDDPAKEDRNIVEPREIALGRHDINLPACR